MERWWINGQPGRQVDVTDRGFTYGDGLFETIALRGGEARFLDLHLDRLFAGCRRLSIPVPARASVRAELSAVADGVAHGVLKLIVTRGTGPRGYAPPERPVVTVAWGTAETEPRPSLPITVRWCDTMVSTNPATAGLKSLGRLEQVLARAEWSGSAVGEGLMTCTGRQLIGGTSSNVFLVVGNRLLTPSLHSAGVAGVMRRVVIEAGLKAGIPVQEAGLGAADVETASEVFVTNALTGIRPVHRLGTRTWKAGPVTRQLQQLLVATGVRECADAS